MTERERVPEKWNCREPTHWTQEQLNSFKGNDNGLVVAVTMVKFTDIYT